MLKTWKMEKKGRNQKFGKGHLHIRGTNYKTKNKFRYIFQASTTILTYINNTLQMGTGVNLGKGA